VPGGDDRQHDAGDQRERHDGRRPEDRRARAREQARQEVATLPVEPERVACARTDVGVAEVGGVRVVRREGHAEERRQQRDPDHDEARDRDLVALGDPARAAAGDTGQSGDERSGAHSPRLPSETRGSSSA
jgi:hypothetical protein